MKRIYHPFDEWEEIRFNMWGESKDRKTDLRRAVIFTSNWRLYGHYMRRVVFEWPVSCENALTNASMPKKSWLGHAAVALALQIPEDITRKAWGLLTEEQQDKANEQASKAISEWKYRQSEDRSPYREMGKQMLF